MISRFWRRSFLLVVLYVPLSPGANAEITWAGIAGFSVESLVADEGTFEVVLSPQESHVPGGFSFGKCKTYTVSGVLQLDKIDSNLLPSSMTFSAERHREALYFLRMAEENDLEIGVGTWGRGSFGPRSCEVVSYGFTAEPYSSDRLIDILTWPSWN